MTKPLTDQELRDIELDKMLGEGSLRFDAEKEKHLSQLVTPEARKVLSEWMKLDADELDNDPEIQAAIKEQQRRAELTKYERQVEDGMVNAPTIEEAQRSNTFKIWTNLIGKCNDTKHLHYRHWGAVGIRVHQPWATNFEKFVMGAGLCPSPYYELVRINPDNLSYEPDNVEWRLRKARTYREDGKHPGGRPRKGEQAVLTYEGKQVTLAELSQLSGIKLSTLRARYTAGKTLEQMLVPVRLNATGEAWNVEVTGKDGVSQLVTLVDLCKAKGVAYATVKARLKKGMPLAQALQPKKPPQTHEERKKYQREAYHARKNARAQSAD